MAFGGFKVNSIGEYQRIQCSSMDFSVRSDKTSPNNENFIVRNSAKLTVIGRKGRNLRPIYDKIRERVYKRILLR